MNDLLSQADTRAVLDILIEQLGVEKAQLIPDASSRKIWALIPSLLSKLS